MLAVSFQGAPCGNGDLVFAFPRWGDFKIMNGSLLPSGPRSAMTTASTRWLFNPNPTQASDSVPPGQLQRLWTAAPRPARTSGDWLASAAKGQPGEGPGPARPRGQTVSLLLPGEASESLALGAQRLLSP